MENTLYHEYRCPTCHKLFFKGLLLEGEVEVKCKSCHEFSIMKGEGLNPYLCLIAENCPNRVQVTAEHAAARTGS